MSVPAASFNAAGLPLPSRSLRFEGATATSRAGAAAVELLDFLSRRPDDACYSNLLVFELHLLEILAGRICFAIEPSAKSSLVHRFCLELDTKKVAGQVGQFFNFVDFP